MKNQELLYFLNKNAKRYYVKQLNETGTQYLIDLKNHNKIKITIQDNNLYEIIVKTDNGEHYVTDTNDFIHLSALLRRNWTKSRYYREFKLIIKEEYENYSDDKLYDLLGQYQDILDEDFSKYMKNEDLYGLVSSIRCNIFLYEPNGYLVIECVSNLDGETYNKLNSFTSSLFTNISDDNEFRIIGNGPLYIE